MASPAFLGVSTGRAGSTYIQRVMNRSGISCTHEQVYEAHALGNNYDAVPEWNRPELGEWSAQAVPFLPRLGRLHVWHQVRDPLAVLGSLVLFRLFPNGQGQSGAFIRHHFKTTGQPLHDAVRYIVEWNRRIEQHATMRWKVEDVDADLICRLGDTLGLRLARQRIDEALAEVPRNTNGSSPNRFAPQNLPPIPASDDLLAMADRYGYAS